MSDPLAWVVGIAVGLLVSGVCLLAGWTLGWWGRGDAKPPPSAPDGPHTAGTLSGYGRPVPGAGVEYHDTLPVPVTLRYRVRYRADLDVWEIKIRGDHLLTDPRYRVYTRTPTWRQAMNIISQSPATARGSSHREDE